MPPILRANIGAEFDRWSMFGPGAYAPAVLKTGKGAVPRSGLVAASYHLAQRDEVATRLRAHRPDVLILDEAHRVKDPEAYWTKNILGNGGIASTAKRIWFATGTPDPNHAGEWYVFLKVAGAWAGTHNQFKEEFCVMETRRVVPGAKGMFTAGVRDKAAYEAKARLVPVVVGNKNPDKLKDLLRPLVMQRKRKDDAPPAIDEIAVEGSRPDFSGVPPEVIEAIEYAFSVAEAGMPVDWRALDGVATSTLRRQLGVAKARDVAELAANELEKHHKALVFCLHTPVIDAVQEGLISRGVKSCIIDGRTPAGRRDEIVAEFQRPGSDLRALVLQGGAAGEGITLTEADRVLIAEPHWSPDANTQWLRRAARRGQTRKVYVSFVYLTRSFDAAVSRTLARKARDKAERAISA